MSGIEEKCEELEDVRSRLVSGCSGRRRFRGRPGAPLCLNLQGIERALQRVQPVLSPEQRSLRVPGFVSLVFSGEKVDLDRHTACFARLADLSYLGVHFYVRWFLLPLKIQLVGAESGLVLGIWQLVILSGHGVNWFPSGVPVSGVVVVGIDAC